VLLRFYPSGDRTTPRCRPTREPLPVLGEDRPATSLPRHRGRRQPCPRSLDTSPRVPGYGASGLHRDLAPYYSSTGRPSIDPELMIRMLIVGSAPGPRRIVIGAIVKTLTIQALQPENLTHKWEFCSPIDTPRCFSEIGIPKFAMDASNRERQDDGNESAGNKGSRHQRRLPGQPLARLSAVCGLVTIYGLGLRPFIMRFPHVKSYHRFYFTMTFPCMCGWREQKYS
jgi:hypothetical protein